MFFWWGEKNRTGYREAESIGEVGKQALQECRFARARRAGNHNGAVFLDCNERGISARVSMGFPSKERARHDVEDSKPDDVFVAIVP